ncbi:hypothetical protein [Aquimarina aquimarini]|uniref:hypothetical protein n=1 Tax=Aquimarina aquimarini TaxID=1191734 RepID=UPI000D55A03B|nr:hypothetical protein [Aquimarina aquimarini]
MMKKFLVLLSLWFVGNVGIAQQEEQHSEIKAIARYQEGKILLRWAVTTPSAWRKGNRYGYTIERFMVKKNGELLSQPQKKVLTLSPITPKPISEWEDIALSNDYAGILAQALYGEAFEVEGGQDGVTQLINKVKEVEQRFSFSLFAADMNFEAAQMAALGYEDIDFEKDAEYVYRVQSAVPKEIDTILYGSAVVNTHTIEKLPTPIDLHAVSGDKNIILTWEYEMFKEKFTSYFIERSNNGVDFKKLSNTPMVNLNDKPNAPVKQMYYVDTLSQNNKKYQYRVIGVSPFGEESPPSQSVEAMGIKKLEHVPYIIDYKLNKSGGVELQWEFEASAEKDLSSFSLHWAEKEKGPYKEVQTNIAVNKRTTTYDTIGPSNYFTISAIGKHKQKSTSFPKFVQSIDTIPPMPPAGLQAKIDTLGIVKLSWQNNTESDLLGYRIYRGHRANEEVVQLTVSPITAPVFHDTVQIKSLNKNVYYQVVAVDKRFNMSEYSEKLTVEKPDIIPPSAPIFETYAVQKDSIYLQWINSSSDDVAKHILYRQKVAELEKGWKLLFTTDTVTSYVDTDIQPNTKYRYAIFAKDHGDLQSLASTPLSVTSQNSISKDVIKGLFAIPDLTKKEIVISWKKMPDIVQETLIYKSKKDGTPVLLRQVPNTIHSITDTMVNPGTTYIYSLKVIINDGGQTKIKTVEVNYY